MIGNGTQCAKALGVTKGRVSQLLKAGVLTVREDGKFDLTKAKTEYLAYLGDGRRAAKGQVDDEALQELAMLKLENQRARLEFQRASTELQKLKSEIQKGNLVHTQAAKLLVSRILWEVRRQAWAIPLRFVHHLVSEHGQQARLDQLILASFETAFSLANHKDIAAENRWIIDMADNLIAMCDAQMVMDKHRDLDSSTAEAAREFALRVRRLFYDMDPALIERLGLRLKVRGDEQ